jgi:hypothetical protein
MNGPTIRVLTQRPTTPVDWIEYAEANRIPMTYGAEARAACNEEAWPPIGPFKVGDDPGHGLYWKYYSNDPRYTCRCRECAEAARRYRHARLAANRAAS